MICAFFGHKDSPESIKPAIELMVKQIAELYPNAKFYVGHNGSFDRMALSVLKKLEGAYCPLFLYNFGGFVA